MLDYLGTDERYENRNSNFLNKVSSWCSNIIAPDLRTFKHLGSNQGQRSNLSSAPETWEAGSISSHVVSPNILLNFWGRWNTLTHIFGLETS